MSSTSHTYERTQTGMEQWLRTFRNGVLQQLSEAYRATVIADTVHLLAPALRDTSGSWWADYVRLRFHAVRR